MLIRLGYDIQFELPARVTMVALLNVHPSRFGDLRAPDLLQVDPFLPIQPYTDSFGNTCCRFTAPAGNLRLYNSTVVQDSGLPDDVNPDARQLLPEELPAEVLRFLLPSRYCETDLLSPVAVELFGDTKPGWGSVSRRFAPGCTRRLSLGILMRARPRPQSMCTWKARRLP